MQPRTLLIGPQDFSRREWLKANLGNQPLLNLDPDDSGQSPPGRLCLTHKDKVLAWRFFGGLEALRAPHVIVAACAQLLSLSPEPPLVLFPAYRSHPILRQTLHLVCEIVKPERILVAEGTDLDLNTLPIGPEILPASRAFPGIVTLAQRKAQWIKLLEDGTSHVRTFDQVVVEGARLGSGHPCSRDDLVRLNIPDLLYAETTGGTVLAISRQDYDERTMSKISDHFHANRVVVSEPEAYWGVLCSFARYSDGDFGMGIIERIDFEKRTFYIRNTAEEGSQPDILRLGWQRIDAVGNEVESVKAWHI